MSLEEEEKEKEDEERETLILNAGNANRTKGGMATILVAQQRRDCRNTLSCFAEALNNNGRAVPRRAFYEKRRTISSARMTPSLARKR